MNQTTQTTRERIIEVATKMLAERGYDGTSLQQIADQVGLRKPSLLHHFPSKAALRSAVVDNLLISWSEVLPQILAQATDGRDRFTMTLTAMMEFFASNEHRAPLLLREILDNPDELSERLTNTLAPWLKAFTAGLRKGQKLGVVRADLDPQAYVAQTAGLALGSFALAGAARGLLDAPNLSAERLGQECIRMTQAALFTQREG